MKSEIFLYSVIMCLISFNNWAQINHNLLNEKKIDGTANSVTMDKTNYQQKIKVKYYHVEEIVPMKFGGHKTVYNVSSPKLIRNYDLGPNSKRIITPVFMEGQETVTTSLKSDTILKIENNAKLSVSDVPKKTDTIASIDIINTYEKVSNKGYETIDILKVVGNYYFFNNQFEKAEKCYSKLFSKTSDLDPSYYFHYAMSLKAVGKIKKANEYYKKFRELTTDNTQ
jgi:tetratricopeptide (TPR) repeat protein